MQRPCAKVLLKARPTSAQIADRLGPPLAGGLELYLDAMDIAREEQLDRTAEMCLVNRPPGFEYVVEGPLRSVDGAFFDVTCFNEANRIVLDRLVSLGGKIGARAAVIHAMAARPSTAGFGPGAHDAVLEAALPMFRYYVQACHNAGLTPTVENVPPVARMREESFMFSLLGTPPADVLFLVNQVNGLRVTVDVSHAQLYVNAFNSKVQEIPAELAGMVAYVQSQPGAASLDEYLDEVGEHVFEAHISNARGLLGEGLAYGDGELDLDRAVMRLARKTVFLVTETIEPDPDRATRMREAQRRIEVALAKECL